MRLAICAIAFCAVQLVYGQSITDTIPQIEVVGSAMDKNREVVAQEILKANPAKSFAELLQMQNGFY